MTAGPHARILAALLAILSSPLVAGSAPPLWIRADAAFTSTGELVPELRASAPQLERYIAEQRRAPHRRSHGESAIAAADQPCHDRFLSLPIHEDFRPTRTADELLASSQSILLGRIVDAAEGFYRGTPGTLFIIDVERSVVPAAGAPARARVFFPYARIVRGDHAYCSNPVGTAMRPVTGDKLLVFATHGASDDAATFDVDPRFELALETRTGELFLPNALRSAEFRGLTLDQLADRLAARAAALASRF
jgi:hypothetical protein